MKIFRLLAVASAAFFIVSPAQAQQPGDVTAGAFAIGGGPGTTGFVSLLCGSAQLAVGQASAAPACQTVTGDVTINAAGVTAIGIAKIATAMIALNAVTNPRLAQMANATIKCRTTVGTGDPEDCTPSQVRTLLSLVVGSTVEAWDADLDCLAALSSTGIVRRTGSGSCSAGTTVSNSELDTMAQSTIKGRAAGAGTGAASDLSAAQATGILIPCVGDSGSGGTKGLVPAPVTGDASKVLFGDCTFKSVAGGGDMLAANNLSDVASRVTSRSNLLGSMGGNFFNLSLAFSVSSNALTIAVKDAAGSDPSSSSPATIYFRSATAATATPVVLSLTSATSLTISSGSTLGTANSTPFRVWIVAFQDGAGTVRIGALNARDSTNNIHPLKGWGIASSTAEGGAGAADNAHTFYSGTVVTGNGYVVLGYASWESGLATAGTWSSGPTRAQVFTAGVPLPGDIVQVKRATTTSGSTTSSSSFQATNLTVSISPSSAANSIDVRASGSILTDSGNSMYSTLARGGTAFGAVNEVFATGIAAVAPAAMVGIDAPGTTSSTTYDVRIRTAGAGNVTWRANQSEIIAMEIMN